MTPFIGFTTVLLINNTHLYCAGHSVYPCKYIYTSCSVDVIHSDFNKIKRSELQTIFSFDVNDHLQRTPDWMYLTCKQLELREPNDNSGLPMCSRGFICSIKQVPVSDQATVTALISHLWSIDNAGMFASTLIGSYYVVMAIEEPALPGVTITM